MDKFKRYVVIERTFERIDQAAEMVDAIMLSESKDRYNIIDYAIIGKPNIKTGWDLGFISDNGLKMLKEKFCVVEAV